MKKGRHRRFEEARKLKQAGPEAFAPFGDVEDDRPAKDTDDDDEYAEIAARYGVTFDEDDEEEEPR